MSEINIKTQNLVSQIEKLQQLQLTCEKLEVSSESVEGGGCAIKALNAIDEEYFVLKEMLSLMIDNSVAFFENVHESIVEADELAAKNM